MSPQIIFQPDGKRSICQKNSTILDAARASGVDIASVCGGRSFCGKCKVIITKGIENLSIPTEAEMNILTKTELDLGYRLACTSKIQDDIIIIIPDSSRTGSQRLQVEGIETPVILDPNVEKIYLKISKPSLEDVTADADRMRNIIEKKIGTGNLLISYNILKKIPHVLREGNWAVTVTIWGGSEIIDIETQDQADQMYGLAVDIGTTKIAGYLINLRTGNLVSSASLMNPQIPFGDDVISRITYSLKGSEELEELQSKVNNAVNRILDELCETNNVSLRNIYEITIVGNTIMHHLFLGISPKFVALSPYVPAVQRPVNLKSHNLNISINSEGNIHVLPVIAGFVGADTVAGILATEIYKSSDLSFMLDIGTNTEIIIGNKKRLLSSSTASGPAFEGAHIKHGMRASTGAIERIWIDPENLEPDYLVIDETRPRGVCGSGLIDAIAEMLRAGIIDTGGRIQPGNDNSRVREGEKGREFVLAWEDETSINEDIVITQFDVREIQKAKAAMYTGASIMMNNLNISRSDVEKVFMAGAFGTYIDPASAKIVGMFPDFSPEKILQVGNAAGTGARMALISKKARNISAKISESVHYLELAADPNFQTEYLNALYFPHLNLDLFPESLEKLKKGNLIVAQNHLKLMERMKK
jgi:uncharacterized 2Fe-2S/4Fe-4S cluster protein (DUF4445 family)